MKEEDAEDRVKGKKKSGDPSKGEAESRRRNRSLVPHLLTEKNALKNSKNRNVCILVLILDLIIRPS